MAILHSFAEPSSNNVLQPSLIRGSGCNTLSHSGLANVDTHKIMFYLLIDTVRVSDFFKKRSLFGSENFKNFVSGFLLYMHLLYRK